MIQDKENLCFDLLQLLHLNSNSETSDDMFSRFAIAKRMRQFLIQSDQCF